MIIKVPIYIEIEGHFNPAEGSEVTQMIRTNITEYLYKQSGGFFTYSSPKFGKGKIQILSETQVRNRVLKESKFSSFNGD